MRVILDTNVLLSAFLRVDSNPYKVVQAWIDGRFELVSSAAQIEEVARVSRYPRIRELIGSAEIGWLVNRIRDRATMVGRVPKLEVSPDPGDNFLLGMAQATSTEFLVTGDKAGLLTLSPHRPTRIVSVTAFVTQLGL
jgi:putative PIN family toxin of toxin-antitoxin system